MMASNAEPSDGYEVQEDELVPREESRRRILTDKGRQYQLNLKIKDLKAKRLKVIKQVRSTLLLRGQSKRECVIKQEFSVAQVLLGEFHDIFNDLKEFAITKEDMHEAVRVKEQTVRDWVDFERDIKAEITYLEQLNIEQQKLEVGSRISSRSKRSCAVTARTNRNSVTTRSNRSSVTKSSSLASKKLRLEQKQAALRVKLSFMDEETKLKSEERKVELMKSACKERLERLQLESEIAQNQAKLNVCSLRENEDEISLEQDLSFVPNASKDEDMKKFLESVSPNAGVGDVGEQSQLDRGACGAVNQTSFPPLAQQCLEQSMRNYPESFTSQIHKRPQVPQSSRMPRVSPMHEASRRPEASHVPETSCAPGVSYNLLEKCMDKLVDVNTRLTAATLEQKDMNRKFAVTRRLPNITIPVFNGDPLQYPI